jgi:hypothetical protein
MARAIEIAADESLNEAALPPPAEPRRVILS